MKDDINVLEFKGRILNYSNYGNLLDVGKEIILLIGKLKESLEKLNLSIKGYELNLKFLVRMKVDENGKKKFSKEGKRMDSEFLNRINRIRNDNLYNGLKNKRKELLNKFVLLDFYVNYILNEYLKIEKNN